MNHLKSKLYTENNIPGVPTPDVKKYIYESVVKIEIRRLAFSFRFAEEQQTVKY